MASSAMLLVLFLAVCSLVDVSSGGVHRVPTFLHRAENGGGFGLLHVDSDEFHAPKQFPFSPSPPSGLQKVTGILRSNASHVRDGDDVVISWNEVSDPAETDWIAMYCPINTTDENFLDYFSVTVSSTWRSGRGSLTLKLFNMREDYEFRYYQLKEGKHVEAAQRVRISVDPSEPCHGHLALGDETTELTLTWTSMCGDTPFVEFSTDPELRNNLHHVPRSDITSRTYSAAQMCGPPANITAAIFFRNPGCLYTAVMKGFESTDVYYYKYGSARSGLVKQAYFQSPLNYLQEKTTRFIAYGDMGVQYQPYYWLRPGATMVTEAVAAEIQNSSRENAMYDVICHFGDLSYAVGHGYLWDQWGWLLAKMAQYVPYMVGVGNHEYDHVNPPPGGVDVSNVTGIGYHPSWGNLGNDSHGECGVPTHYRFRMPRNAEGSNSVFWYYFEMKLIRFVMVSTEHSLEIGSLQYNWLESVLAGTDRQKYPWLVLMGHRPAYSEVTTESGDNSVSDHLRQQLDDLLMKYRVNLMLTGHLHAYERSCPGYMGDCRPDGTAPVHVVVGTSGAQLEQNVEFPADFTMKAYTNFGYCRMEANITNLHVDFVVLLEGGKKSMVADTFDVPLWKV